MDKIVAITCECGKYETQDPNDAHFDVPGHWIANIETAPSGVLEEETEQAEVVTDHMAQPGTTHNLFDTHVAEPTQDESQRIMDDETALNTIQHIMSGEAWDGETLSEIAETIRMTGRDIEDV